MQRASRKRTFDLCDSPISSTPPRPPPKRQHVSSASSSSMITPSDSPTNPFKSNRSSSSRSLPKPTPISEHIVLRFQLGTQGHANVYRIAQVPMNYTFLHLHRLILFLFGWSEEEQSSSMRKARLMDHRFQVQKEVILFAAAHRAGLVKSSRTWAMLGKMKKSGSAANDKNQRDEAVWEREESFVLQRAWPRGPDEGRAITYVHDYRGRWPHTVYVTVHTSKVPLRKGFSNNPYVFSGHGLPDDDEDDDDFPIDLHQWNEEHAFQSFISGKDQRSGLSDDDEDDWTPEERVRRIEEAHARMKQLTSDGLPDFDQYSDEEKEKEKGKAKDAAGKIKKVKVPEVKDEDLEDDLDAYDDEFEV